VAFKTSVMTGCSPFLAWMSTSSSLRFLPMMSFCD